MITRHIALAVVGAIVIAGCSGSTPDEATTTRPPVTTEAVVSSPSTTTTSPPTPATQPAAATTTTTTTTIVASTVAPITNTPATLEPVDVTTEDGRLTVGGDLPDDVDPLVVVPDDFEISIGSFTDVSSGVTGASSFSVDELTEFYVTEWREASGVEPVVDQIAAGIVQIGVETADGTATVVVSAGPEGTTSITIAVER